MFWYGDLTPEQIQAWIESQPSAPVIIRPDPTICDACQQKLDRFYSYLSYNGIYSHLEEPCLSQFHEKHLTRYDYSDHGKPTFYPDGEI
jgi:hypothetical protein